MPPNVLFLICDTARADAFSPWGGSEISPNLERLCSEGIVYSRAISAAPWTLPATASIFSGRTPTEHGANAWAYRWENGRPTSPAGAISRYPGPWLPEEFRSRGHATFAASSNPWISTWSGFHRGFEEFHDVRPWPPLPSNRIWWAARRGRQMFGRGDHGGAEALRLFARWLGRGEARPWFALVNLMELHAPYDPPVADHPLLRRTRWTRQGPPLRLRAGVLVRQFRQMDLRQRPDPAYVATIRALYAGAARYADRLVGRFATAAIERSRSLVVVVVSDHGENLGDHGLFAHHSSLHESLLHVPLLVWGKGCDVEPGRVDGPVSLLGLGAWLLGLADGGGTPIEPGHVIESEYESTERHLGIPREIRAWADRGLSPVPGLAHHSGIAIRDGSLKYVGLASGEERLLDLDADPHEGQDILGWRANQGERFRPRYREWLASLPAGDEPSGGQAAELEIADHLKTLGYIE